MIVSLASEALHFTDPRPLLALDPLDLEPQDRHRRAAAGHQDADLGRCLEAGSERGEVYDKVGRAMAMVNAQGHAIGLLALRRGLFGTDVFLACVYAVYMYTVFRVKLSQEFNRILPELPELVERVLGVWESDQMGEAHG